MADHYTKASFIIDASPSDIAFLREISQLDIDDIAEDELRDHYESCSARFKNAFPGSDADPFEAYRNLYSDPDFARPCFDIHYEGKLDNGLERVVVYGDQIEPETLANMIQASCPSALPTGFCYAYGCSKLRPDEFGGGFVVITENDIIFQGTQEGLRTALAQIDDEDERQLVITTRHPEHGMSFWNNDEGFGRLTDATVFSQREALNYDLPIAADQPEWTTMPRWPQ